MTMNKLAEKYGNIFSLRRGLTKIVYVSGYKLVKEALVSERFARCVSPLFDDIYKGRGLSFTNGYSWRKYQQFSVSFFKKFGESRETLQQIIQQECYFLCGSFRQEQAPL
ncbi:cytochrome P450 2K6-like [Tachysurus vachellii]|uniref:cytochrome P450 2K6-like n=1 Tax=Tachysurus vachellii TaxID=175792 RepID=UPI00296AE4DC|nr:cytochrome P450 2K6-like [Tachysurus vachellii]